MVGRGPLLHCTPGMQYLQWICDTLISNLVVASCDGFLDCGETPSFLLQPLGILMVSSLVMLAVVFVFFDRNSISLPLIPATAISGRKSPMLSSLHSWSHSQSLLLSWVRPKVASGHYSLAPFWQLGPAQVQVQWHSQC